MPLPSSGVLTLQDIQTEFGGSNPIGLNEYYAGGAFVPSGTVGTHGAVPSSGALAIRDFYGTSAIVTITQTVTVGSFSFKGYFANGFSSTASFGSVSDGTFDFISSATIVGISWDNSNSLVFAIDGTYSNSGWTKMTIDSVDYTRTSASFNASGGQTSWTWTAMSTPFGVDGSTKSVVFTQ